MTDSAARTVVIGLGNPLMGDDGIGLVVLEQLRDSMQIPATVELVDGGTWGMNLLPRIEDADHLLLLDAIRAGRAPGAVVELRGDAVPRGLGHKLSPHQIDLKEVLAVAMLRGRLPADLVALGVEPSQVEMSTALSLPVTAAIPEMVARAMAWVQDTGQACRRERGVACTN